MLEKNDSRITGHGPNAGFWNTLPRPIIGLSPMDGVTDAAFRQVVAMQGAPDVTFTEFTSVGDICRGPEYLVRNRQALLDHSTRMALSRDDHEIMKASSGIWGIFITVTPSTIASDRCAMLWARMTRVVSLIAWTLCLSG